MRRSAATRQLPPPSPLRDVRIGGERDGRFDGRSITVLRGASITGQLGGEVIDIHGTVCGRVCGRTVRIRATGCIEGEVEYGTLAVDPGARLNARCVPA